VDLFEYVGEIVNGASLPFYPPQDANDYKLVAVDPDWDDLCDGSTDPSEGECNVWALTFESGTTTPGPSYTPAPVTDN
jgi:hypothetical protein